jgi:hypothetical protein
LIAGPTLSSRKAKAIPVAVGDQAVRANSIEDAPSVRPTAAAGKGASSRLATPNEPVRQGL